MKKHKVSFEDLLKGKHFNSYADEVNYIQSLMSQGKISPIKASGTNGKRPAMCLKFWLYEDEADNSEYIDELRFRLSPKIDTGYYLSHIDVYKAERDHVLKLDDYLCTHTADLEVMMSENERSYAIWQKEKFLSGQAQSEGENKVTAAALLRHCKIDPATLNTYHTAEPMAYFSLSKSSPQNILILENLDPFYSIRRLLMSGNSKILGSDISTLIYGGGKRVNSIFSDFELLAEDYLKDSSNHFYYFGDLDYEGIGIFESFAKRAPINVVPFIPAYKALIQDCDLHLLPISKERQNKNIDGSFWNYFDPEDISTMKSILDSGKYIPQEKLSILNY